MSQHPNVILTAVLTPDGLSRKTMREIMEEYGTGFEDSYVLVGEKEYNALIMESNYDEGWQISAQEGDLVFFDLVTYGYGERVEWDDLESLKGELEEWAQKTCEAHHCSYRIWVTANHW